MVPDTESRPFLSSLFLSRESFLLPRREGALEVTTPPLRWAEQPWGLRKAGLSGARLTSLPGLREGAFSHTHPGAVENYSVSSSSTEIIKRLEQYLPFQSRAQALHPDLNTGKRTRPELLSALTPGTGTERPLPGPPAVRGAHSVIFALNHWAAGRRSGKKPKEEP